MKKIDDLKMYVYKEKGKVLGEYFFLCGFKIFIFQATKKIRRKNSSYEIIGWCFNIFPSQKSKYFLALQEYSSSSNVFQHKNTCIVAAMREAKHLYNQAMKTFMVRDKAFIYEDTEDDFVYVVYATSAMLAKKEITAMFNVNYIDVRVKRCPWADKYKTMEEIPATEWLANGYSIACECCGKQCYEEDLINQNQHYFCRECSK